ncbi:polyprenyl synthetase family protein [Sulfobacillus thermosulfidooxidans]|uniref:polyprenyl synthetase family protein n=1 Tax=Sulfobacillus thermosulfidooxidans TaxID=28034 RepID=UPI0006B62C3D|nr:farnesyl diphosphate synthase [Sulfobacillus thermosulfidooxidans]
MDIGKWLEETRAIIEQWIREDHIARQAAPGTVEEVMRYSLLAGGKRLRPQLVMASTVYLGLPQDTFRDVALAVEYIHTYSLIHDDLPAMDNDDLRRGQPTAHKMFPEAMAILSGDALLTEAFVKMSQMQNAKAEDVLNAITYLAVAVGRQGLIKGQVMDLAAEHHDVELAELQTIHRNKTGALFQAALVIPALLTGNHARQKALSVYGEHFGLAFQIVDDILNVVGKRELLGKNVGTDSERGKATYPRLVGIEQARRLADDHRIRAKIAIGSEPGAEILRNLIDFAVDRQW